jgi:hypothetical protein
MLAYSPRKPRERPQGVDRSPRAPTAAILTSAVAAQEKETKRLRAVFA